MTRRRATARRDALAVALAVADRDCERFEEILAPYDLTSDQTALVASCIALLSPGVCLWDDPRLRAQLSEEALRLAGTRVYGDTP